MRRFAFFNPLPSSSTSDQQHNRRGVLTGSRILVVADDPLMAVDHHFQVREMGTIPVGYKIDK
jgi:hypothetical protein